MSIDLYDKKGKRKYLNQDERNLFELAAKDGEREVRTFSLMLLYTDCRISEALTLKVDGIDFSSKATTFWTLKKHRDKNGKERRVYRSVPLPEHYLDELNLVHNLKKVKRTKCGYGLGLVQRHLEKLPLSCRKQTSKAFMAAQKG